MTASLHDDEKASSIDTTPIDELRPKQDNVGGVYIQSRGVTGMEAIHAHVNRKSRRGRFALWAVAISVLISAWAYSLDQSTTSSYTAFATSDFQSHSSGLAALSIATSIIGTVCKPFIAKISDITSRPYTYILTLILFIMGYIIIAFSPTLAAYVVGSVFAAIGASGLDFLNDVIVADLTPLEWRGFVGSLLSTPYLINTWFAGLIVKDLTTAGETNWRWGYGMFAIIMPVCLVPAITTLIFLERRARKEGLVNLASSTYAHRLATEAAAEKGIDAPKAAVEAPAVVVELTWSQKLRAGLAEADAFGLLLLGAGWTLFLLPFSLEKTAKGNWNNPSMIAMLVVGAVLLVAYVIYERFFATVPSFPRRLLFNKTFMMAIVIDFFYLMCGNLRGLYLSSYTYIITTWDLQSWTYFSNTMSLSLCFFGVVAGLIQRWTHRYKALQITGLSIKIIGLGILLNGHAATSSTGALVMSQILIGMGGSFSVVGSRVAAQASVPHQDLALVMALLSLWSSVGGSVGVAIAAQIWAHFMPKNLRTYLPASVNDTQVMTFYGSIKKIHVYPFDSPIRQGALEAYRLTLWHLLVPAICLSFIPLTAAFFQTNFYLGKQQNAVMNVSLEGTKVDDSELPQEPAGPLTFKEKLLRFWAGK